MENEKIGLSDFKNKLIGQKKKGWMKAKINFDNDIDKNRKGLGIIKKDQTYSLYRVTNGRLNLKLNSNQMKSLNKLKGLCGIKTNNKDENNKKIKHSNNNINNENKSTIKLEEDENKINKKYYQKFKSEQNKINCI